MAAAPLHVFSLPGGGRAPRPPRRAEAARVLLALAALATGGACWLSSRAWLPALLPLAAGVPALAPAPTGATVSAATLRPLMGAAPEGPELCFLVRVMPTHMRNLAPMLLGLFASAAPRHAVRAILLRSYALPPEGDVLDAVAAFVNAAVPGERVGISRWDASYTEKHYPHLERVSYAKDGGFVVTGLALEDVLARRQAERAAAVGAGAGNADAGAPASAGAAPAPGYCDALVVTNGDHLHTGGFVPAVVEQLRAGHDLVGVHFISRYEYSPELQQYNRRFGRGPLRVGTDAEFLPVFTPGGIDLGAAAVRTDLLDQHGVRFVMDRLRKTPSGKGIHFQQADGQYYANLAHLPGVRSVIVPRALFVHQ